MSVHARAAVLGALTLASAAGLVLPAPGDAQRGHSAAWSLPAPGSFSVPRAEARGADAACFPFRSGDLVAPDRPASARSSFPEALSERRDPSFYDGMQLEVGPGPSREICRSRWPRGR